MAAGTLARPFIANAAAKAGTVWWTQGFLAEEDASFHQMVAQYEKVSGNKIDYSLIPFALTQKIIAALTSGDPGCDFHRRCSDRPAERLERQAGGRDRGRGNPEGALSPHRLSGGAVLQQCHQFPGSLWS
jgi:hypothetical protein